jgi:ribonuclease HI
VLRRCIAYIDGGSRGNPGIAGYGVHLLDEQGKTLASLSERLGIRTNNFAEYSALIAALSFAESHQYDKIKVYADSELLVRQINGTYRVRNPGLRDLYNQAQSLISRFKSFSIHHIPREQNREADRLANLAMDLNHAKTETRTENLTLPFKILAVFQNGSFKPLQPLDIPENTRLCIRVEYDDGSQSETTRDILTKDHKPVP